MNTGDRIKQRRIELGLSVDDLAEKIGKSRATIYRYENGDIENMPTPILEPLAKALDTTPADLMGWTQHDKYFSGKEASSDSLHDGPVRGAGRESEGGGRDHSDSALRQYVPGNQPPFEAGDGGGPGPAGGGF